MFYGDRECFASLDKWLGAAEEYWTNLERLFMVADYAKKHAPSVAKEVTAYSKRIVELFRQTKDYASLWNSKRKEKNRYSTEEYTEVNGENWNALDAWTKSQEELRQEILDFMELLYSLALKP